MLPGTTRTTYVGKDIYGYINGPVDKCLLDEDLLSVVEIANMKMNEDKLVQQTNQW